MRVKRKYAVFDLMEVGRGERLLGLVLSVAPMLATDLSVENL